MKYTKEELLAKAKRDYPVGTKFYSAYSNEIYRVDFSNPRFLNANSILVGEKGSVYHTDKWATIISTLEIKIHFNYLIL